MAAAVPRQAARRSLKSLGLVIGGSGNYRAIESRKGSGPGSSAIVHIATAVAASFISFDCVMVTARIRPNPNPNTYKAVLLATFGIKNRATRSAVPVAFKTLATAIKTANSTITGQSMVAQTDCSGVMKQRHGAKTPSANAKQAGWPSDAAVTDINMMAPDSRALRLLMEKKPVAQRWHRAGGKNLCCSQHPSVPQPPLGLVRSEELIPRGFSSKFVGDG